jgi:hypothetical protein
MTEARRADIVAIALAAAAMLLVGTVPAYSSSASSTRAHAPSAPGGTASRLRAGHPLRGAADPRRG